MKKLYIYALFTLLTSIQNMPLMAGLVYVNDCFIDELIEQTHITISNNDILIELKHKLRHNCRYIKDHEDLLENYINLYQKHMAGKSSINFLLSRSDGRAQYKPEFVIVAPFIKDVMSKKSSRATTPYPAQPHLLADDGSDEFFTVSQE